MKQSSNFFKLSNNGRLFVFVFCVLIIQGISFRVSAQSVGDYRSVNSGNWSVSSNWEYFNGSQWVAAVNYPGQNAGTGAVTISDGFAITLNLKPANSISLLTITGVDENNKSTLRIVNDDKTLSINVPVVNLEDYGQIYWDGSSSALILPADADLFISGGGGLFASSSNSSQRLDIGNKLSIYATSGGGAGAYTFAEVNAAGGTVQAILNSNSPVCSGNIQITISYDGTYGTSTQGGTEGVAYTLKEGTVVISSGTFTSLNKSSVLSISKPAGSYSYSLEVVTYKGSIKLTQTATKTIVVYPPFSAGEFTSFDRYLCKNSDPEFIGSTTVAGGGDGNISYEWRANGIVVASASSASYDPPSGIQATTTYTRWAKDNTCQSTFAQSAGVVTFNVVNTWLGSVSSDWNDAANWCTGQVPDALSDVLITYVPNQPQIVSSGAVCKNLMIDASATLLVDAQGTLTVDGNVANSGIFTIGSNATSSGSLIVNGTSTGNITYNRYLENNRWYMLSSPLYNSSAQNSLSYSNIAQRADGNYNVGVFSEAANGVQYKSALPVVFEKGVGYFTKLSTGNVVSFTGTLNNSMSDVPTQCSNVNYGWNAVGNPFTSSIKITEDVNGFIDVNKDILRPGFQAIYIWSGPAGGYKAISKANYTPSFAGVGSFSDQVVQAGQGFLVNIEPLLIGSDYQNGPVYRNISFTKAMQVHSTVTEFKRASSSWPGITLLATSNGKTREAMVAFNRNMTLGLDESYDAGLLKASDFNVYTYLVGGGNTTPFTMQCLPDEMYESLTVEIGVELKTAGKVTFKAAGVILPEGLYPVIEDRLLHTFTLLKSETDCLTVDLAGPAEGDGRFYLHFSRELQMLGISTPDEAKKLTARFAGNRIEVQGMPEQGSKAWLFDISGRIVLGEYFFTSNTHNEIPVVGLPDGMYLLKIDGKSQKQTLKIPVVNN